MAKRILIADDELLIRMDLRQILEGNGYEVVDEAEDGIDAVKMAKKYKPDIILMDVKMPIMDGISATKMIHEDDPDIAVVMITAYNDSEFVNKAVEYGVVGYVVKPVQEAGLLPVINVASAVAEELAALRQDLDDQKQKLEARKDIERAKGILIKQKNISEEEAFKYIRTISMNKRLSMKDVAQIIIETSAM